MSCHTYRGQILIRAQRDRETERKRQRARLALFQCHENSEVTLALHIMNDERLDGLAMTYKYLCLTEHLKHLCVYILIRLSLNRRNSRKDLGQNSSPYLLGKSKWMSVLCHSLIFGILIGQIIGCMHWCKAIQVIWTHRGTRE